jgi:hypothetical protein
MTPRPLPLPVPPSISCLVSPNSAVYPVHLPPGFQNHALLSFPQSPFPRLFRVLPLATGLNEPGRAGRAGEVLGSWRGGDAVPVQKRARVRRPLGRRDRGRWCGWGIDSGREERGGNLKCRWRLRISGRTTMAERHAHLLTAGRYPFSMISSLVRCGLRVLYSE